MKEAYVYKIEYSYVLDKKVKHIFYVNASSRDAAIALFRESKPNCLINHISIVRGCSVKKEEKKVVDLHKKVTIDLTEDDIKEIIAEYANEFTGFGKVTKDNVEMEYHVVETGPQHDSYRRPCLKKCVIKVG